MAAERLLRLGHRASVLRDCADRLKQAADGLALIAERDNAYYSQVCFGLWHASGLIYEHMCCTIGCRLV
jgi:hypothetical protein